MGILLRLAASAAAVWVATLIVPGISVKGDSVLETVGTFVAVAVIFGVINAVLRPIIKTIGCAFYTLTLGLIALVVNGLLLLLTEWIANQLDLSFTVDSFWPAGILGALVIGLTSWAINFFITKERVKSWMGGGSSRRMPPPPPPPRGYR